YRGLPHGGGSKMLSEHGSAPRRRKSRASRYAVPLAIPVALGLTFGVVMAVTHGGAATTVAESALGTCASASASAAASAPATAASAAAPAAVAAAGASAPATAASASASAAPCPSASASGAAPATTLAIGIPPVNPPGRAGAAGSNAVDAAGNAFSFTQTSAE